MDNFLQHRLRIIEDFCNSFKIGVMKEVWGIDVNCNVKSNEVVWLYKQLLKYQTLSQTDCVSGCTYINPSCVTEQYCGTSGIIFFPQI